MTQEKGNGCVLGGYDLVLSFFTFLRDENKFSEKITKIKH